MAASSLSVRFVMTPNPASSNRYLASAIAPAPALTDRRGPAATLAPLVAMPLVSMPLVAAALLATALLATSLVPLPAFAQAGSASAPATSTPATSATAAPAVTVDDAWVRATVSKQRSTGAFFNLASSRPMRLVAVESPAAEIVEIHEMALVDNIMRMRAVDAVPIAPGQRVELQPSGLHVMLIDLDKPIQVGDVVPLTLVFEDDKGQRTTQAISATVRPLTASGPQGGHRGGSEGGHGSHGAPGQGRH